MRRREFIILFGSAAVAWPFAARSQQPGQLPIIGYMGQGTPAAEAKRVAAFVERLRELSWIEGRTVVIEYRWTDGRSDLAADFAAEFARRKVIPPSAVAVYRTRGQYATVAARAQLGKNPREGPG